MKKPRDYQTAANAEAIAHCRKSTDPFLMVLSVGSGKTLMIADLLKNTVSKGGFAIALSHQGELTKQNSDEAWQYKLPNSIFAASLGQKKTTINPIFAMRQTLANALDEPPFLNIKVDLIVVDEVHTFDFQNEESGAYKILKHFRDINPKLRIIGLTGTPYRNNEPLYGNGFWKDKTTKDITLKHQISEGWITDFHYGLHDESEGMDFSGLDIRKSEESGGNYSEDDFDRILQGEYLKTMEICHNVHTKAQTIENGCLIFCGSKLHTEQVKLGLINAGAKPESIAIVTDNTSDKDREFARLGAISGEIKYFINVGVASTGWNVPRWQYLVYMRPVASRTFFEQSLGRPLRPFLTPEESAIFNGDETTKEKRLDIIARSTKPYAIVDDYAGVVERLGDTLEDFDEVQEAKREKSIRNGESKVCPICSYENGAFAQRCMNVYEQKQLDGSFAESRCLHYWQFNECRDKSCRDELERHTQNSVTAKTCRVCEKILADPNAALLNRAYRDDEYRELDSMSFQITKNKNGVAVTFHLTHKDPDVGTPRLFFNLKDNKMRGMWKGFVDKYVKDCPAKGSVIMTKNPETVIRNKAIFDVPTHITVRKNEKGFYLIGKRIFKSGREVDDGE